ncbi:MAG: acetaldehyde dehydrogenase (acetylating) [Actinomycetota bacterium]
MPKVAIIGSGNIGTDLMFKVLRGSGMLEMAALAGIDPGSDGLARARRLGVATTSQGVDGLVELEGFGDIEIVFDATSAKAHLYNNAVLQQHGKQVIDLTPAAVGPFVVPLVNLDQNLDRTNVNLVSCGGQATIPIVAAVRSVTAVLYAEIVASIASKSAGPGTRANIDEFTHTTARGLERVGKARSGKAVIILNPAEPPLLMRDTVLCLVDEDSDLAAIEDSVEAMVAEVQRYVPGYRLKQRVQFDRVPMRNTLGARAIGRNGVGVKATVFLEVEGAAHYLPAYAGNLDIMTSAAVRTGERLVELRAQP